MLVGTVYLFRTMPTGFIPSQDSGFLFARDARPAGHFLRLPWREDDAVGEIVRAHPDGARRRRIRAGRQRRSQFRHGLRAHEAARPAHASVDQMIEELRPKIVARSRRLRLPAESAADHDQRPERGRQLVPAHAAEREPEGDLRLGAASWWTRCGSCRASWTCNTDMQIASPQVMVDIDRDRALALGITPQQVQDALFSGVQPARSVGDLRAGQPVFGDPGSAAAIPAQSGRALEAVSAVVAGRAGAARHAWCGPGGRPARCRSTISGSCPR